MAWHDSGPWRDVPHPRPQRPYGIHPPPARDCQPTGRPWGGFAASAGKQVSKNCNTEEARRTTKATEKALMRCVRCRNRRQREAPKFLASPWPSVALRASSVLESLLACDAASAQVASPERADRRGQR